MGSRAKGREMTPDEVNDACSKFVEHLRVNGVSVHSFTLMCYLNSSRDGVSEKIDEIIICHWGKEQMK